jgi:3-deoxy-D-manno-octulosonic-acid transferase
VHALYQLASYLVIGLLLPVWALHPKLRQGILRRLGFYGDVAPPGSVWPPARGHGPRILLHGASAGDLLALLPIIERLRARAPEATLMVSTMTNSGFAIAQDRLQKLVDGVTFVPYDLPGATRRALAVLAPDLLVLEYTELWPNLIQAARRRGAKVALTNGRLSESLVRRYRWMAFFFGNPLAALDLLLMREEVEADRALALGAPAARIRVTGNTKFDNLLKAAPEAGDALREALGPGLWLVAGSTHEGEEKGVLQAFRGMRAEAAGLRLLIAPRYVERGPKVAALARHEGFKVGLRSEAARGDEVRGAEVVVLDSMGELATAYSLATLVFVGGSFVPRGGQNILEPAGQGRPVLFGPNMQNFRDSVEVLLGRGGIQVTSVEQLEKVGRELLARPEELEHLGGMARAAVQKIRGASERNAEALLGLVRTEPPNR